MKKLIASMQKLNTIYLRNLKCTLIENLTLWLFFLFFCHCYCYFIIKIVFINLPRIKTPALILLVLNTSCKIDFNVSNHQIERVTNSIVEVVLDLWKVVLKSFEILSLNGNGTLIVKMVRYYQFFFLH